MPSDKELVEKLVARAIDIHDALGCGCDRKYLRSCPRLAAAILQAGKEAYDAR